MWRQPAFFSMRAVDHEDCFGGGREKTARFLRGQDPLPTPSGTLTVFPCVLPSYGRVGCLGAASLWSRWARRNVGRELIRTAGPLGVAALVIPTRLRGPGQRFARRLLLNRSNVPPSRFSGAGATAGEPNWRTSPQFGQGRADEMLAAAGNEARSPLGAPGAVHLVSLREPGRRLPRRLSVSQGNVPSHVLSGTRTNAGDLDV